MSPHTVTGHFCWEFPSALPPFVDIFPEPLPPVAHLIRPGELLLPIQSDHVNFQSSRMHLDNASAVTDILCHTTFGHRSPPAACNSSSFLSSRLGLVSMQALWLAITCAVLALFLCPSPFLNPSSIVFELTREKVWRELNEWRGRALVMLLRNFISLHRWSIRTMLQVSFNSILIKKS